MIVQSPKPGDIIINIDHDVLLWRETYGAIDNRPIAEMQTNVPYMCVGTFSGKQIEWALVVGMHSVGWIPIGLVKKNTLYVWFSVIRHDS